MGAYTGQSIGDLLSLLEQCAVTLLDRWNVQFTPQVWDRTVTVFRLSELGNCSFGN